jgi:hypothetical protein
MNKFSIYLLLFSFLLIFHSNLEAQDTIHVQCFTYGSAMDSSVVFPSDTIRFQKILMNYKLRCPYTSQCGQWDYLTYTYLYQPTGLYDSTMHVAPSYVENGMSPDTFQYMTTPSYSYHPYYEKYIVHNNTISFDSATIAGNTLNINHPLNAAIPVCRSQYLWTATQLSAAGLIAGNITGIRFNIQTAGSVLQHLTIRVKASTLDSVTTGNYEKTGFTTVFNRKTTFSSAGWQPVEFTNFFNWDGVSNLVFDISYSNQTGAASTIVKGANSGFSSGVTTALNDRNIFFQGSDYIDVPYHVFDNLDSAVTISFWAYGDLLHQPQNQSIFQGNDSLGQRVLNCHLPWGDGTIYWDAGNSGTSSYDRVSKAASAVDYAGNWTYWTFTKSAATGRMKIYKNGVIFTQTLSNTRLMHGIRNFKIGSFVDGTGNYAGAVDDFAVFNTEVDQATIQSWMFRKIDNTHPFYSNLLLYYNFDQPSVTTASDSSLGHHDGALFGIPAGRFYTDTAIFKNLVNTSDRPDIILEQGVYNSSVDSTLFVDSTANDPVEIVHYRNTNQPTIPTDSAIVYPPYNNNYRYFANGNNLDSSFVTPDSTIYLIKTPWWDPPYLVTNRYELGRYITPYGNGLSLGNGFTWIYDVSDYRTLLHDTVHLAAGNNQELLDLSFDMIKGIPPRDPISVQNIYKGGGYSYGNPGDPIENHFPPVNVYIDSVAKNTRIKNRSTGHGEDVPNDCSEFCPKYQYFYIDTVKRFTQLIWKTDCSLNPLYPQGGTWVYSRANWCPGGDVPTFDYEITPYVTPGDSALINLDFQPYVRGTSSNPYYQVEAQLIKYGPANFSLDAAIYDIKSPTDLQIYQRHNPICNDPLITIQNTGTTTLTSLTIAYGQVGGTPSVYNWTGNLAYMQKQDVQLNSVLWNGTANKFQVTVSNPNGGTDQYAGNNTMTSSFTIPVTLEKNMVFELGTNNEAYQNAYTLRDDQGNIIISRSGLTNNTVYRDTVTLADGCYTFRLTDTGDDGLSFWANPNGGSGYMQIKRTSDGTVLQNFGAYFVAEIYLQFTAGYTVFVKDLNSDINMPKVYPSPSSGNVNILLNFNSSSDATVEIYSIEGDKVYSHSETNVVSKNVIADLSEQPTGIYLINVRTNEKIYHLKLALVK